MTMARQHTFLREIMAKEWVGLHRSTMISMRPTWSTVLLGCFEMVGATISSPCDGHPANTAVGSAINYPQIPPTRSPLGDEAFIDEAFIIAFQQVLQYKRI